MTEWIRTQRLIPAKFTAILLLGLSAAASRAAPLVPGTGVHLDKASDDFEDPAWAYQYHPPKGSGNLDEQSRSPAGGSNNGRWFEGPLRGQPDVVERVSTPPDGIAGSTGARRIRTLRSGIPGRASNQNQQDDLIANVSGRLGGFLPVSSSPSCVTRVYLPPFDEWELRGGNTFGFRAAVETYTMKPVSKGSSKKRMGWETYWPGIFIQFNRRSAPAASDAVIVVRGDQSGRDFLGPRISEPGWWTLGISFTPDGQVHYYARPGVDDLTPADHLASQYPYGYRAQRFTTFFFNVVNLDNGRSWSTDWIVDDPAVFAASGPHAQRQEARQPTSRRATPR